MLTVLVFAALGAAMQTFVGMSLHEALYQIIRMPFDAIGEGLGRGMLYILSLHVLWFAGIHGANVLDPITHDIYGAAMLSNEVAAAAGEPLPHIMTKTFMDTFVFMGGAGTGISLAGALILFGKTQASRKIGIFSLVPGLFNINEVLLFGLPIVLNPLMLIPFLLTPCPAGGDQLRRGRYGAGPGDQRGDGVDHPHPAQRLPVHGLSERFGVAAGESRGGRAHLCAVCLYSQ